jgi:hypothetical protein
MNQFQEKAKNSQKPNPTKTLRGIGGAGEAAE